MIAAEESLDGERSDLADQKTLTTGGKLLDIWEILEGKPDVEAVSAADEDNDHGLWDLLGLQKPAPAIEAAANVAEFLAAIWGPPGSFHSLCWKQSSDDSTGLPYELFTDPGKLAEHAATLPDANVWVGINAMAKRPKYRGGAEDVTHSAALFVDLDWRDVAHANPDKYPPEDQVRERLAAFIPAPTHVVCSGHGLQAYWAVSAPMKPKTTQALQTRLDRALTDAGLVCEGMDLARILRLPGTTNFKTEPVPVRLEKAAGSYTVAALDKHLPKLAEKPVPAPTKTNSTGAGPIDMVLDRLDLRTELLRRGFQPVHGSDGKGELFRHPTSTNAQSVRINIRGRLHVFSASLPLPASVDNGEASYDALDVIAAYSHGNGPRSAAPTTAERTAAARDIAASLGVDWSHAAPADLALDGGEIDLDDNELEFIDWTKVNDSEDAIVEGLAIPGRWTAIAAPAKAGKSELILNISIHVSQGRDPFDRTPIEPVTVLYLDAEMGRVDLGERIRAAGYEPNDLDRFKATDIPPRLDTRAGGQKLLRGVQKIGAKLVVIDGINGTVEGAENDDTTWRAFFAHSIAPLKRQGIAVLSADNLGKDAERGPRGSSVKLDKPDAVIRLTRTDHGAKLVTTHRRTAAYPAAWAVSVAGLDGDEPTSYRRVDTAWPEGTELLAAELDQLGIDPNAGRGKVLAAMKEAGLTARNEKVAAAIRYRRIEQEHRQKAVPKSRGQVDEQHPGTGAGTGAPK